MPRVLLAAVALLTAAPDGGGAGTPPPRNAPAPHVDFRERATPYSGPGRERPEPADAPDVPIGYFGPDDPAHPEGGDAWVAARLAVDAANRSGGYRGKPFRLVVSWSDNPWKAGIAGVTRLVYHDRVWAIVGGIDGPTAHLAEQVVAKARLPLVVTASTDRTANAANVPWIVSLAPGDHLIAPKLAGALADRLDARGFALVSLDDHDARALAAELKRALRARQFTPRFEHVIAAADDDTPAVARQVAAEGVGAVVVAADARASAAVVRALRAAGFAGTVVGGPALGRRRFALQAGAAAEGAVFPLLFDPESAPRAFVEEFTRQAHAAPDFAAATTYDAMNLLIAAVRTAGLNRARIGDALRDPAPREGATGPLAFDRMGSNRRPVGLATYRQGRVVKLGP